MSASELPDVVRLRTLDQVERRGSLTAAAAALGVTTSAVSQHVAALEREVGVSLVERRPRGVVLTGAGRSVLESARAALQALERTRTAMDQVGGELSGTVAVGSIASAAASIVLPAAERLARAAGDIDLTVTIAEPSRSIEDVVDGRLDLAVIDIYDNVPLALPEFLAVTEIHREPLVLVSAKPQRYPRSTTLADLRDAEWLLPPPDAACGAAIAYACREVGFEPTVRWHTDDLLLLVECVARGQGISLLPRLAVADAVVPVSIRALAPSGEHARPLQRRILTVTRAAVRERPIVRAVLDELGRRPEPIRRR